LTGSDFDKAFGVKSAGTTFAERVGRADSSPAVDPAVSTAGDGAYKPFGFLPTNTVGETCDIQRWIDGTEIAEGIEFQYRFLMQIAYVGEEEIRLFLPDCIVLIEGKNLRELRRKLARRQVTFVQQYSAKVWPVNPLPTDPLIQRIQVIRPAAA